MAHESAVTRAKRRPKLRFALWLVGTLLASLLVIAAIAVGVVWMWFRGSLPQTTGTITVAGVSANVRIVRDPYGVPTIHASSPADAYFGLGYVHAQDRFFQMEMQRHTTQGRVSELAGPSTIETDKYMRKLGLYKLAEADEKTLTGETKQLAEAYAKGVNAWLARSDRRLSPEFGLLRVAGVDFEPSQWRPADSLAWPKVMALLLSGNFEGELVRAEVTDKIGAERAPQLFAQYPPDGPVTVNAPAPPAPPPAPAPAAPERSGSLAPASARDAFLELLAEYRHSGIGSNAWVIGPSRSTSGHPLLSNDTHLPIQSPSIFYLARLEAPGLQVVGATLPGVPGVILGRNERIAWGMTNLGPDSQDLFLEKLDPKDPSKYLSGTESLAFRERREEIRVAGRGQPVVLIVKESKHGPIVRDDWNGRGPLALRWPALDPGDTSLESFLAVGRASNWTEFRAAVSKLVSPGQNFVFADNDGHIGYTASGRIPIRKQGRGDVPVNGWDGEHEWTGYVPFEQLPSVFDPPEGFIVTANNKVTAADEPYLGSEWAYHRAARIRQLILARPKHSLDDLVAMRSDRKSLLADQLLPALLATPTNTTEAREAEALAKLAAWDRVQSPDSAPGAIFVAWYTRLLGNLMRDDLGVALYDTYAANRGDTLVRALSDPTGYWCDDKTTPTPESCKDIAHRALREAVDELSGRLGRDMNKWRLDQLTRARFASRVGSMAPVIGSRFVRVVPMGGDGSTVAVSSFSYKRPYRTLMSSATIAEYEVTPGGATRMALPTGQSEHPLSRHFDDYLAHWRKSEGVEVPTRTTRGDELVLVPAGRQ